MKIMCNAHDRGPLSGQLKSMHAFQRIVLTVCNSSTGFGRESSHEIAYSCSSRESAIMVLLLPMITKYKSDMLGQFSYHVRHGITLTHSFLSQKTLTIH